MRQVGSAARRPAVIIAITGLLFISLECSTRFFFPQNVRVVEINQETLGVRDSVLGYRYRADTRAVIQGPEFTSTYEINSQGLRDATVYGAKTPGVTRILLLGDSFAFGAGCEYPDTWGVVLEDALCADGHRVEVVKAGMVGFDTRTEMLFLERIAEGFDPDIVLVALLPNDIFTNQPIATTMPDTGFAGSPFVFQSVTLLKRLLIRSDWMYIKLYLATARRDFFLEEPSEMFKTQVRITKDLLLQGLRLSRETGREFFVISLPQQFQVLAEASGGELGGINPHAIDHEFAPFAKTEGFFWIPTLDVLATAYRTKDTSLYFRYDGHLNREGSRVLGLYAATVIGEHLRTREP